MAGCKLLRSGLGVGLLALFVVAFPAAMVLAQEDGEAPQATPTGEPPVMMTVDADDLFPVIGFSGMPIRERTAIVAGRIVGIAQSDDPADEFVIVDGEFGPEVHVGDIDVIGVPGTSVEAGGLDAGALAHVRGLKIIEAIANYRERRPDEAISHSRVVAGGWSAAFFGFCIILVLVYRRFIRRAHLKVESWVRTIGDNTGRLPETEVLFPVIRLTDWIVVFILFFLALCHCTSRVLFSFPAARGVVTILLNFSEPVLNLARAATGETTDFIARGVIHFLTRYILKIVKLFFVNIQLGANPAMMTIEGYGDTDLAVPAAAGVREARNRRVVVNLAPQASNRAQLTRRRLTRRRRAGMLGA